jgi:hypothetical protein
MPLLARAAAAVLLLLAVSTHAAPAAAQGVRGRVVDAANGAPVPSAIVVLETEGGERVLVTLTDSAGRFELRAPAPGGYRLHAERVGYAAAVPTPVELGPATRVEVELRADSRRVALPAVEGVVRQRPCERRVSEGVETARLWDEARKALLAASLAEAEERYRFRTALERGQSTLRGLRLPGSERWEVTSAAAPFRTVSGEALVRDGYLQVLGDSLVLHGIGAAAVVSDDFLDTHCFGVLGGTGADRHLVGLEFVPLAGGERPDVRGVLWMDRSSSELRFVEFTYTGVRLGGPRHDLGGRLDFRTIPGGGWVLWSWSIRAPLLHPSRAPLTLETLHRPRIWGYQVTTGQVVEVRDPEGELLYPAR